jgi:hypothetical protein
LHHVMKQKMFSNYPNKKMTLKIEIMKKPIYIVAVLLLLASSLSLTSCTTEEMDQLEQAQIEQNSSQDITPTITPPKEN